MALFDIGADTQHIPQTLLNIEQKTRSNPLRWNGQFSPQFVEALLSYTATPAMTVYDPFVGSGTVLLEAGRQQMAAIGTELNPAAIALARLYRLINLSPVARHHILQATLRRIEASIPFRFASEPQPQPADTHSHLLSAALSSHDDWQQTLLTALLVLLDGTPPSSDRVYQQWHKLARHVNNLPYSAQPIQVEMSDARATPLPAHSVDLVLTSPPYINVFNYHQQYRPTLEALGWDILSIARSEIGANRKHRGNRFLTVIQYCLDMALVIAELSRVCRPHAQLILVVGRESRILGVPFYNSVLVRALARLPLVMRQERVFQNRFGQQIVEDILHFANDPSPPISLDYARQVAASVLEDAYTLAPPDTRPAIRAALDRIGNVLPSDLAAR